MTDATPLADAFSAQLSVEKPLDIIGQLPSEISLRVFGRIRSPRQLCRCSAVSRTWRVLANDDLIWRELCRRHWARKKHIDFDLHIRVDYTEIAPMLTIKEMKSILKRRKVDFKHLLEKKEFINRVVDTLPPESPRGRWAGKWKASFIVAELDTRRHLMTKEELCSMEWNFRFLYRWPDHYKAKSFFRPDYTYESDITTTRMHWRFYSGTIQVEQYPPLRPKRDPRDWGWILTNDHVILHSIDPKFEHLEAEEAKKRAADAAALAAQHGFAPQNDVDPEEFQAEMENLDHELQHEHQHEHEEEHQHTNGTNPMPSPQVDVD